MTLKELRKIINITQAKAASIVGMPLRTYINYENDFKKANSLKYKMIFNILNEKFSIDENKGILKKEDIINKISEVFNKYKVNYCYLFGSYAKNNAIESSDVDLLIDTEETGLTFYGLIEELRETLHKRIDLLDIRQLKDNYELVKEILKDGIKIYG